MLSLVLASLSRFMRSAFQLKLDYKSLESGPQQRWIKCMQYANLGYLKEKGYDSNKVELASRTENIL